MICLISDYLLAMIISFIGSVYVDDDGYLCTDNTKGCNAQHLTEILLILNISGKSQPKKKIEKNNVNRITATYKHGVNRC